MSNTQNLSIYTRIPKKSYLELTLPSGSTIMCRLSHVTIKYYYILLLMVKNNIGRFLLDILCNCLYTVGILV
jgi:hypothetical protein